MQFTVLFKRVTNFKMLVAMSAIIFGAACGGGSQAESERGADANTNAGDAEAAVALTVGKAVARDIPSYIQATGSLIAEETSDIASKVGGRVTNIYANVGQFVTLGSVIAKLDENEARLQVAQAEANVNQAIAGVRQSEARLGLAINGTFTATTIPEVRAASANYEQVLAELRQAEANEKRYRELIETGDVSMIVYEQYRTQRDTARARLNNAKQLLDAAANAARQNNEAIKSAQAAVESARTQVGIAQQAVADTTIRAPFSGYISSRPTAVGEYVTTATPVATILRVNPIKIQIQIAEADISFVSIGRGVSLEVDAYRDRKFAGTVAAVNPAIDPTSRAAVVEASIENGDNALRPGMFATAQITREGGSVGVFVPRAAVLSDQSTQSYRVFVIQEGVAKLRVVQLGTEEAEAIQILSGVNADETVATSNLEQLYEGAKVSF